MKCKFEKRIEEVGTGGVVVFYDITLIPESEEDKEFIVGWSESEYIERWVDNEGNVRLLI